jgi:hypothetical protein
MRLSVASLRRMIKGKLHVELMRQELTSYSGLEVLRRYLRQRELPRRLRAACAATGDDYGGSRLALLVLALLYVGALQLERLRDVAGDPLNARFCGLARMIPTSRTVANWLRQFTTAMLAPLVQLNHDLVTEAITLLQLPRLTIDVDGTVVTTGATVAWAFRASMQLAADRQRWLPVAREVSEPRADAARPAGRRRRPCGIPAASADRSGRGNPFSAIALGG